MHSSATDEIDELFNKEIKILLHQFTTNKLDEIHLLCEDMRSDLLVITENGFNRQNIDFCTISNFNLANAYCQHQSKGAGVAIFLKQKSQSLNFSNQRNIRKRFESIGIKISSKVVGIYSYPSGNEDFCVSKLELLLTDMTNRNQDFIFMVISTLTLCTAFILSLFDLPIY
ncbi:hypothetical protein J6590_072508 [Homalodisca vitripennis]|nr:hypothetical protein J6590_072508 [Homalodisca vitripennis]